MDVRERLAAARADAEALVAALEHELAGLTEATRDAPADDEHDPDGAATAFERQQNRDLLGQTRERLHAIERAEARLAAGTYGVCDGCGDPIAPARLEARPAAATCIACAGRRR